MQGPKHWHPGLLILIVAYPLTHFVVQYIPNPFIPTASLALNMIFPVLAGYFFGPLSGALAGALGTGFAALLGADLYDAMAILSHASMGVAAGFTGVSRAQFLTASTVIIGHALNILFYWRFGLLQFEHVSTLLLGLLTETTIDMVAIVLLIVLLQKWLHQPVEQRW